MYHRVLAAAVTMATRLLENQVTTLLLLYSVMSAITQPPLLAFLSITAQAPTLVTTELT